MNYQKKLKDIKKQVSGYYEKDPHEELLFHNISHTKQVVAASKIISGATELGAEDEFVLLAAAWFHDTGYLTEKGNHEERGSEFAAQYLLEIGIPPEVIAKVKSTILATRMGCEPENETEQILKDADLFHLGAIDYANRNKLLKKEYELQNGTLVPKLEWLENEAAFFKKHQFYTTYCQSQLNAQKNRNLEVINEKINREKTMAAEIELKKEKSERPERGIETMFKITSGNNQRLSDMADNKAHILITVNSIILSAIISLLLRRLDQNQPLIIPTFILLAVCLSAMVFAILATRPTVPSGQFRQQELQDKTVNLLFFGNFYKMALGDYASGMGEVMKDHDFLYGMLIKDVHSQGIVLGKKYRLLRVSYNIFMFGIIAAVLAFTIASLINNGGHPATVVPILNQPAK